MARAYDDPDTFRYFPFVIESEPPSAASVAHALTSGRVTLTQIDARDGRIVGSTSMYNTSKTHGRGYGRLHLAVVESPRHCGQFGMQTPPAGPHLRYHGCPSRRVQCRRSQHPFTRSCARHWGGRGGRTAQPCSSPRRDVANDDGVLGHRRRVAGRSRRFTASYRRSTPAATAPNIGSPRPVTPRPRGCAAAADRRSPGPVLRRPGRWRPRSRRGVRVRGSAGCAPTA